MGWVYGHSKCGTIDLNGGEYDILCSHGVKNLDKVWAYKIKHKLIRIIGNIYRGTKCQVAIEDKKLYLVNIQFEKDSAWTDNLTKEIFFEEKVFLKQQNTDIKVALTEKEIDKDNRFYKEMEILVLSFKNGELSSIRKEHKSFLFKKLRNYIAR